MNTIRRTFEKYKEALLQLIFPQSIYCICCGIVIDTKTRYGLCDVCRRNILWNEGLTCMKCGKHLSREIKEKLCGDCRRNFRHFDRGFSVATYSLLERHIISELKFNGKSYIGNNIAEILYDKIVTLNFDFDVIIPIPIHRSKNRKRGFNQSEVIAVELGKLCDRPVLKRSLCKIAKTKPMKELRGYERKANIQGSIAVGRQSQQVADKTVLLVDDIYTTGATADECSRVLKGAGAAKVYVISFASGADVQGPE